MRKCSRTKITRFKDGEFYIDIVEKANEFEAWVSLNDYGISILMFGVPKQQPMCKPETIETFRRMVEHHIDVYGYNYRNQIMEERLAV